MAKARKPSADVQINMTPMIDCTFQLIIFFILTTQMTSKDLARLVVPDPLDSKALAEQTERADKVIVNIVNEYGNQQEHREPSKSAVATNYVISGETIELDELDKLQRIFRERRQTAVNQGIGQDFLVEVRADKDVAYGYIEPILSTAAAAGIAEMNMTAIVNAGANIQQ